MQAPAVAMVATVTNPLDILMSGVNSNPYFIGLMMLLLNLGGRFLSLEISKEQGKIAMANSASKTNSSASSTQGVDLAKVWDSSVNWFKKLVGQK